MAGLILFISGIAILACTAYNAYTPQDAQTCPVSTICDDLAVKD